MSNQVRALVLFWAVAAIALAAPAAATNRLSALKKADPAVKAGKLEQEVLSELNLARQKPQDYARFIEEHRRRFRDEKPYSLPGGMVMTSQEGVAAVDEAIGFLKKVKPVGALDFSFGLSLAARDHVADLGPKGQVGHNGSDGSDPGKPPWARTSRSGTTTRA